MIHLMIICCFQLQSIREKYLHYLSHLDEIVLVACVAFNECLAHFLQNSCAIDFLPHSICPFTWLENCEPIVTKRNNNLLAILDNEPNFFQNVCYAYSKSAEGFTHS